MPVELNLKEAILLVILSDLIVCHQLTSNLSKKTFCVRIVDNVFDKAKFITKFLILLQNY